MVRGSDAFLNRLSATGEVYVLMPGPREEWESEGQLVIKRNGLVLMNPSGKPAAIVTGDGARPEASLMEALAKQEKAWTLTADMMEAKDPAFNRCKVKDMR